MWQDSHAGPVMEPLSDAPVVPAPPGQPPASPPAARRGAADYALGAAVPPLWVLLLFLVVSIAAPPGNFVRDAALVAFLAAGVSQLLVVLPVVALGVRSNRRGLWVGACVSALVVAFLNVTCFALFWATFR